MKNKHICAAVSISLSYRNFTHFLFPFPDAQSIITGLESIPGVHCMEKYALQVNKREGPGKSQKKWRYML